MKKLPTILSILFCVCISFAWYKSTWQGIASLTVTPEDVQGGDILISTSISKDGTNSCTVASKTIKCLHSDDGITFVDENNATAQPTKVMLYMTSSDNLSSFHISNVTISDDSLKESLRIAVVYGNNQVLMYDNGFPTTSLGTLNGTNTIVEIRMWYEGTDSNCTLANALASNGSTVEITFEGEE